MTLYFYCTYNISKTLIKTNESTWKVTFSRHRTITNFKQFFQGSKDYTLFNLLYVLEFLNKRSFLYIKKNNLYNSKICFVEVYLLSIILKDKQS